MRLRNVFADRAGFDHRHTFMLSRESKIFLVLALLSHRWTRWTVKALLCAARGWKGEVPDGIIVARWHGWEMLVGRDRWRYSIERHPTGAPT